MKAPQFWYEPYSCKATFLLPFGYLYSLLTLLRRNFGNIQGVASPFKFSDAKLNMRGPSPKLGQDDNEF